MTPAEVLSRVRSAGFTVRPKGDGIAVSPASSLPADLRALLLEYVPGILAVLRREPPAGVIALRRRYDALLVRFHAMPDTPEAVESREWKDTVADLNRVLLELAELGYPATDDEILSGFGAGEGATK